MMTSALRLSADSNISESSQSFQVDGSMRSISAPPRANTSTNVRRSRTHGTIKPRGERARKTTRRQMENLQILQPGSLLGLPIDIPV